MWRSRSVNGVTLASVLTALFCAAVLGYIAAIHQTSANADGSARKYVLNIGPVHLNLTVGVMGVLVIFIMTILLALAMGFALIASYRRKQAEAANRQLLEEVSERKRAQHEVSELNSDLERRVVERTAQLDAANKELEAFSYSVAHDLRAPLRQIGGFSQILVDEYGPALDSTAQHYLKMVQDGSRNMGQLVDDLLKLGRIGRQELACRPTD